MFGYFIINATHNFNVVQHELKGAMEKRYLSKCKT